MIREKISLIFPRTVGVKGSRKDEVLATREAMRILVTFFLFPFFPTGHFIMESCSTNAVSQVPKGSKGLWRLC